MGVEYLSYSVPAGTYSRFDNNNGSNVQLKITYADPVDPNGYHAISDIGGTYIAIIPQADGTTVTQAHNVTGIGTPDGSDNLLYIGSANPFVTGNGINFTIDGNVSNVNDGSGNIDFYNISSSMPFAYSENNNSGFGTANATKSTMACYCTGTLIRIVRHGAEIDTAVEDLCIGDHAVTASGAHRPIKWIGTRSYAGRFVNSNPDALPICFKVGSLGDGVPSRDLWVSPKHAMFLDGCLIPAEHLVNGATIVKAQRVEAVTYWHVELDSHDVLLTEGAPSESFVDDNSRGMFHNAHTFAELYPDALRRDAIYCAPRVENGYVLEAVRRRLAIRAGLHVPTERSFGELRGYVDGCDGTAVWGWAQDLAYPDAPVCLDVLVDGTAVGLVLAGLFRADLAQAGIGDGCHAFRFTLPSPLSPAGSHVVTVRPAADGKVVGRADAVPKRKAA